MATSLYDLAVNVSTNTASLETGFNKIGDLIRQQTAQWQRGFDGFQGAISKVQGVLGALGVALSAGAFVAGIKSVIDYADALNDLSKRTGIAVETLGGLGYAAKQSGVDLETVARGSQKLAQLMAEAAGGGKQAQAVFDLIGVSARNLDGSLKATDQALFEIADKFQSFADGPEKAALAVELFKKGGEALIPLLDEGGDKLRALVEEYRTYGGVTADTAQRADAFNDTLAKIQLIFGALFRQVASALLPTLQTLADIFLENKNQGGGFEVVATGIAGALKTLAIVAMGTVEAFRAVGKSIYAVLEAVVSYARGDSLTSIWQVMKSQFQEVGESIGQTAANIGRVWESGTAKVGEASERNFGKVRAPVVAAQQAIKQLADEGVKFLNSLLEQENALGATQAELLRYKAAQLGVLEAARPLIDAIEEKRVKLQAEKDKAAEAASALEKLDAAERAMVEGYKQATASAEQLVQSMQDEIDAIGQTNAQREISIRLRDLERLKVNLTAEEYEKFAAQIRNLGAAKETALANQNLLQGWRDFFTSVADYGANFIADFVTNGSSAFKRLWEDFKGWALSAFAKIAAQTLVVNIAGAFSPQLGGIASQALGGGGFNLASLFGLGGGGGRGGIGSWLSSGGIFSSGLGGAFATSGIGQALGLSTLAEFSTGSMALTGLGTTLGAAIPIIGAGLAIASAFNLFSKGGGPKEGGTAGFQSYYPGETTAAGNTAMQQAITAIQSSYDQLVAALGGKGSAAFALGFDTDPRGTAQNRVSAAATVGGKSVYSLRDIDVGRDSATLQAELQTQAQRALLSALRASDLPKYLADILDSVNIDVASATDIQNLLAYAAAAKQAVDSIQGLGTAFATLDPEQIIAVADALGGIEAATQGFAYLQQNFTTAADKLERAQQQLTDGFEALGLEVPKTHEAFLQLVNDLIALGDAADAASVISLAGLFVEVNGTADQAAQSITTLNESLSSLDERAADLGFVITDVGAMIKEGYSQADAILGKFSQLASNAPDFGSKLSIQLTLIADALKKASPAQFSSLDGFNVYVKTLQKSQTTLTDTLARFTILSAQFDATRAEQLIGLQDWYDEQQRMFRGNAAALSAVETLFQQKWSAIVNGVAVGVDGTIDQLARLRQGIADYLKGLLISDLSPLTPQQKLEQAQSAYVETLLKAQSGDLAALGDITKYADAYLKQARDFFASSAPYSDIFASVTGQLTGLATAPTLAAPTQGDIKENTQATRDMEAALLALLTGQHAEDTALGQSQLDTLRQIAGARNRQAVVAR